MADAQAFVILVIDECPSVHLFIDLALGGEGVRVVRASDGYTALACLNRVRPHLVFAEDDLAGVAVPHLVEALRTSGVPVVSPRPLDVVRLRDLVSRLHTDTDSVDAWLGTADAALGTVPAWWERASEAAGFSGDVAALRAGQTRERLKVRASQFID